MILSPITSDPLQKRKTTTISVEVKKSQHKYIIGPKGNTLQEILEATGVSVEMPPLDSGSETIILRGEPDKLGPALTQVYAKVRRGWRKTSWYWCLHFYFRAENTCCRQHLQTWKLTLALNSFQQREKISRILFFICSAIMSR